MRHYEKLTTRRAVLGTFTAAALFTTRGLFAEQLALTPPRTEGPFYPDQLPLDTDNDLILVNDGITPAVGEITHLTGRIFERIGHADPERNDRDLAVRRQSGLSPHCGQ